MARNTGQDGRRPGRTALNFWVDLLTALAFAAMVGTGILAKWILPPGSRGGVGLTWLGQGRHFWGDVHFWVAVAMLVLVIIHVWLHWSWILSLWGRLVGRLGSPATWLLVLLLAALIFLPLIIPATYSEEYRKEHELQEEHSEQQADERYGRGQGQGSQSGSADSSEQADTKNGSGLLVDPGDITF
jgi:uncharacterized membrane protein